MNNVRILAVSMTDEESMLLVKNGEAHELETLFRRHSKPIFGYLYSMCRDVTLCEDLVQEAFWRILLYRKSFDGRQSFRAWAYRIARNLLIDRQRWQAGKAEVSLDSVEESIDPHAPSSLEQSVTIEDQDRLRTALHSLPRDQREILVLARYEELSFREIAQICCCREGTAKVRAFRALQALRKAYLSSGERKQS